MVNVTIGKKEYEVTEQSICHHELEFYEENPRIYSILRVNGEVPSQRVIEDKLKSMEHVKQLRLSILQNGGIIDPIIVAKRDGKYVVLEGNSRLAAYRILSEKNPLEWSYIKCNVLPENITDSDIFTLLGQYHLVGRKDWSKFEQAAYLHRQKETSKLDNAILAKNVGMTESKVNSYLTVYSFMLEYNDLRPDRWSYYEEYLKNNGIKKYRNTNPDIDNSFVKMMKKDEIEKAIDVRDLFGKIAKTNDNTSKKLMGKIIAGDINLYEGYDILKSTGKIGNAYQKIKKFREIIVSQEFAKQVKAEAANNNEIAQELKKIKNKTVKLMESLNL